MKQKVDFRFYLIGDRKMCAPRILPLVIKQAVQTGIHSRGEPSFLKKSSTLWHTPLGIGYTVLKTTGIAGGGP
jgi:hypothetical protein